MRTLALKHYNPEFKPQDSLGERRESAPAASSHIQTERGMERGRERHRERREIKRKRERERVNKMQFKINSSTCQIK